MPSHIDAWVGQWKEAIECNIAAVEADDRYVELTGNESQFYKFYRMHNHHFVVWCAMFDGQYETALKYAMKAVDTLPAGDENGGAQFMLAGIIPMGAIFLESYVTMPWHVMIRFGKWDEILAEPMYDDKDVFPATIATQHYARGVAYASKGMVPEAEAEQVLFNEALANPALAGRMMHNNFMYQDPSEGPSILNVNASILEAEIEYRRQFLAKANGEEHDFTAALMSCAVVLIFRSTSHTTNRGVKCNQSAIFSVRCSLSRATSKKQRRFTVPTSNFGKTTCGAFSV